MTRVNGANGTDPESLTFGEKEGSRQIDNIQEYLTQYVPGFENAYFLRAAPFIGIWETRRIVENYVLLPAGLQRWLYGKALQ